MVNKAAHHSRGLDATLQSIRWGVGGFGQTAGTVESPTL